MSYVRSKMINGYGPYYYLVKTERVGTKVRQVHIAYLGKNPGQKSGTATKASLGVGSAATQNEVTKKQVSGSDYNHASDKESVAYLSTLSLKELRRRQDINQEQIKVASESGNDKALTEAHRREKNLIDAIMKKEFADDKKEVPKKQTVDLTGLADKNGVKSSEVNQSELKKGIKVEMEHTKDKKVAKQIATDHLTEDKKYYTHLAKMEKDNKVPKGQKDNVTSEVTKTANRVSVQQHIKRQKDEARELERLRSDINMNSGKQIRATKAQTQLKEVEQLDKLNAGDYGDRTDRAERIKKLRKEVDDDRRGKSIYED